MAFDKKPHFEKLTEDAITVALQRIGYGPNFLLEPLQGGANNQVFRVSEGAAQAVLKIYFQHPKDPRNRLDAEFEFGSFVWSQDIKAVSKPVYKDPKYNFAIYEYIPGRPLSVDEVTRERVQEAIDFFSAVNRHKPSSEAQNLPLASEAFFSIGQHVAGVSRRIDLLGALSGETETNKAARHFVSGELIPAWKQVQASLADETSDAGQDDRCLSPSDFGFHNAVLTSQNRLAFFDFEYAGWDDPAKTICDFFCQPKVPVPLAFYDLFAEGVAACTADPKKTRARAERLLPLYRIKWCCILLNAFLPVDQKRRQFSGVADFEQHKISQLDKAKHMLSELRRGGGEQ